MLVHAKNSELGEVPAEAVCTTHGHTHLHHLLERDIVHLSLWEEYVASTRSARSRARSSRVDPVTEGEMYSGSGTPNEDMRLSTPLGLVIRTWRPRVALRRPEHSESVAVLCGPENVRHSLGETIPREQGCPYRV
jgi:hypothetical protein